MVRSFHGTGADGQRYAVDRIANHATLFDGTFRVQVYWTEYPYPTWMNAAEAPHEKLRVHLRRAARLGLPHTSSVAAHVCRPAAGGPGRRGRRHRPRQRRRRASPPRVRARPLGSARQSGAAGGEWVLLVSSYGAVGGCRVADGERPRRAGTQDGSQGTRA